jgi:hypothetical protein
VHAECTHRRETIPKPPPLGYGKCTSVNCAPQMQVAAAVTHTGYVNLSRLACPKGLPLHISRRTCLPSAGGKAAHKTYTTLPRPLPTARHSTPTTPQHDRLALSPLWRPHAPALLPTRVVGGPCTGDSRTLAQAAANAAHTSRRRPHARRRCRDGWDAGGCARAVTRGPATPAALRPGRRQEEWWVVTAVERAPTWLKR